MPFGSRRSRVLLIALLAALGFMGLFSSRWVLQRVFPIRYGTLITSFAHQYQLDPYLVAAVIQVESHYDPQARSGQGALGLMQLMPETAEWITGERGGDRSDLQRLFEPTVNINLGCWYLRSLLDEFRNDVVVSLAAYNGGRGKVREWLLSERWTGERETVDQIPYYETRFYVRRVLATRQWYKQLYKRFPQT